MKVYISASLASIGEARAVRDLLEAEGHEVTSSWLKETPVAHAAVTDADAARLAQMDLDDVRRADVLLLLNWTDRPSTGGGMWVEVGAALALQIVVLCVGDRSNMFLRLPQVRSCADVASVLRALHAWQPCVSSFPEEVPHVFLGYL